MMISVLLLDWPREGAARSRSRSGGKCVSLAEPLPVDTEHDPRKNDQEKVCNERSYCVEASAVDRGQADDITVDVSDTIVDSIHRVSAKRWLLLPPWPRSPIAPTGRRHPSPVCRRRNHGR